MSHFFLFDSSDSFHYVISALREKIALSNDICYVTLVRGQLKLLNNVPRGRGVLKCWWNVRYVTVEWPPLLCIIFCQPSLITYPPFCDLPLCHVLSAMFVTGLPLCLSVIMFVYIIAHISAREISYHKSNAIIFLLWETG